MDYNRDFNNLITKYKKNHKDFLYLLSLLNNKKKLNYIYENNLNDMFNLECNLDSTSIHLQTINFILENQNKNNYLSNPTLFDSDYKENENNENDEIDDELLKEELLHGNAFEKGNNVFDKNKMFKIVAPLFFLYFMKIDNNSILNSKTFDESKNNQEINYQHQYNLASQNNEINDNQINNNENNENITNQNFDINGID